MAIVARHSSGACYSCQQSILEGDLITLDSIADAWRHEGCEKVVVWDHSYSDPRMVMEDMEEARLAPLQRPVCQRCFLELPKSMICGSC